MGQATQKQAPVERAIKYLADTQSGKLAVNAWIKKAIASHYADLARQRRKDFAFKFSPQHAEHVINFFGVLKLAKGNLAGEPFDLMPWQAAILYLAYGWREKSSGRRRYKKVIIKVPRGNAKTEFLAGVGNYGFLAEGEGDPEIYWVATKKKQASIGWRRQRNMLKMLVRDEPALKGLLGFHVDRVFKTEGDSFVEYLGKDSDTEDGPSPYYGLFDEIHAYKDDEMINVVESGMTKREDPMTWMITTAGYVLDGPYTEIIKRCKQMLDGIIESDDTLAMLYEPDEGDDWRDEKTWAKVNPSIGYALTIASIRTEFKKIQIAGVTKEIDFKVKNLNIDHSSNEGWITDEKWMCCAGAIDREALKGRDCYVGVDLSLTTDISAVAFFFPSPNIANEPHQIYLKYWIPEEQADIDAQNGIPYRRWIAEGWVTTTDGNVVSHDELAAEVLAECANYNVIRLDIDPWNSAAVQLACQDAGIRAEKLAQTVTVLSRPTQELERLVAGKEMNHGGDPVLRWMMSNVVLYRDTNNNIRVHKGKSKLKVDGVAATVCALAGWLTETYTAPTGGSYLFNEDTELLTF